MSQDITFTIPFQTPVAPLGELPVGKHIRWLQGYGLIKTDEQAQRYRSIDVPELVRRVYPTSQDFLLALNAIGWEFLYDDFLECDTKTAIDVTGQLIDSLVSPPPEHSVPLVSAHADLWQRLCTGSSEEWLVRITANRWSFFSSCLMEVVDQCDGRIPSASEYLNLRLRGTADLDYAYALAERFEGYELPPQVWHSSRMHSMRWHAGTHKVIVNEVHSEEKEEARRSFNLIRLLMSERNLSHTDAVSYAKELADRHLQKFLKEEEVVPEFCDRIGLDEPGRHAVGHYLDTLRNWVNGNYAWHCSSGRYNPG
ncbi:hypothetical protein [Streptomyces sp. MNP-20]|uniref:terpene synthase family protein n=1 Tax=Streptomyces sp. MNP-20 TaxID=2721165 RepID=UPI0015565F9E|nr:hypothetical protein [Streptomyces sp. MNP-20]